MLGLGSRSIKMDSFHLKAVDFSGLSNILNNFWWPDDLGLDLGLQLPHNVSNKIIYFYSHRSNGS